MPVSFLHKCANVLQQVHIVLAGEQAQQSAAEVYAKRMWAELKAATKKSFVGFVVDFAAIPWGEAPARGSQALGLGELLHEET